MRVLEGRLLGTILGASTLFVLASACGEGTALPPGGATGGSGDVKTVPHTLYVAHEGAIVAYDIATGAEIPGSVSNVSDPRFMQSLDDGTVLLNNSKLDEILVVAGRPAKEIRRLRSSSQGGKKPVESYITPAYSGKTYWVTLNDGNMSAGSNTITLVDATKGSPTWLEQVGEVAAGNGHHQAGFSATQQRVVVSSFYDCENVLSVYDFTNPKSIKTLATLTAKAIGFDGSTMAKTCDPTGSAGIALKPHGCATSKASGKVYCNVGGPGLIAVTDVDATPPTFTTIATSGRGGGYTKAISGGKFIYSVQASPREGNGGVACQIGQLVTIDAETDKVTSELPLRYKGAGCNDALVGTDEETDGPNRLRISQNGKTMFVAVSGGSEITTARVRQEMVFDLASPAAPVQLASIKVGTSTGERATEMSGDGKWLFVADVVDATVTQIDVATLKVVATIPVKATPRMLATFGTVEGPSYQIGPVH